MDKNTKKQFKAAWVALKYLVPVTAVVINGETIAEIGKRLQKKAVLRLFELAGSGDAAITALKATTWNVTLKRQVGFDLLYQSGGITGLMLTPACTGTSCTCTAAGTDAAATVTAADAVDMVTTAVTV